MEITDNYLFVSERLGFRNWKKTDIKIMSGINADPIVMNYFPSVKTVNETIAFIERMQKQFTEKGFCYFAVDILESNELIGFIGLFPVNSTFIVLFAVLFVLVLFVLQFVEDALSSIHCILTGIELGTTPAIIQIIALS